MSKTIKNSGNRIVFFGSGPVAAASLEPLAKQFEIEAVVTKSVPDHHRELAPVEELAKKLSLNIYFANTKTQLDELINQQKFHSRLGVIVDFGVIVSEETISSFDLGIINSHFSLLPRWRGADPITYAILSGDDKTGVSLMLIEPTLDTGKIMVQKSLKISSDETTPSLTNRLVELSNELLAEYLPLYLEGKANFRHQPHPDRTTFSHKISKEDGLIDWQKPAEVIEREIRAYIDWPKSRTTLAGKDIVITKASISDRDLKPGQIVVENKHIHVGCGQGSLDLEKLKPAGKNEMTAEAFLAGHKNLL